MGAHVLPKHECCDKVDPGGKLPPKVLHRLLLGHLSGALSPLSAGFFLRVT